MKRQTGARALPLKDLKGNPFRYSVPDLVTDLLHQIDRGGGTFVELPEQVVNPEHRDRYVVRSLIEEAITSSQLEGAVTTRIEENRFSMQNIDVMKLRGFQQVL